MPINKLPYLSQAQQPPPASTGPSVLALVPVLLSMK